MYQKHKVFISYHHKNDQYYKEELLRINKENDLFIDMSVDTGDISEDLSDQDIRQKIRDDYLKDSTVTILLLGTETKDRKHVDWEIYSSMYDGKVNKKSGILVINLPTVHDELGIHAGHGEKEKELIYPGSSWTFLKTRKEYEDRHPYMPERIIDNLVNRKAKISVTNWNKVQSDPSVLNFLIQATFDDRTQCDYDLSRPMRRKNSPEKYSFLNPYNINNEMVRY